MTKDFKKIFEQYAESGGSIKNRDSLTLDQWKEFKEALDYFHQQSSNDGDKWRKLTGNGRLYDCFIQEVNHYINQLRTGDKPKPDEPRLPNKENLTKYGSDYFSLKPVQQEGRQKTQATWTNKKNTSFLCFHCQTSFPYDKSISSYLEARNKAKNELNNHKNSCSYNNNTNEGKLKAQQWWTEVRNSKTRIIKTCETCWGKVLWDKSIIGADDARVQALSDLKYHQDHECHLAPEQRTIAIYHSPNNGGNKHAPINPYLLNTDDGIYSQDKEGQTVQEQENNNNFNWKPWAIGGVIVLAVIGIVAYFFTKKKTKDN